MVDGRAGTRAHFSQLTIGSEIRGLKEILIGKILREAFFSFSNMYILPFVISLIYGEEQEVLLPDLGGRKETADLN